MAKNTGLYQAKIAKKDEFYTQLTDIEKELKHYKDHFKGKVVLCNCDDPRISNFFKFFVLKFETLGLKEVIATCYKSQDADLFSKNNSEQAVYLSVTQKSLGELKKKNGGRLSISLFKDIEAKPLKGDGDFRSSECIEFLKRADIICTNPPFSLFREYVAQLIKFKKQFLIIGSLGAIGYKEIFPLIKEGKIWLGASIHSGDREFGVPDDYPLAAANYRIDADGKKYLRIKGVRWFTNLDYKSRHDPIDLYKKYNPKENPKYDNYDAVEVSKTLEIPVDYKGVMGVPVTFMDKYCPQQFEILGMCENEDLYSLKTKTYSTQQCKEAYFAKFGKSGTYDLNASGVLIKKGLLEKTYLRILIKRKCLGD